MVVVNFEYGGFVLVQVKWSCWRRCPPPTTPDSSPFHTPHLVGVELSRPHNCFEGCVWWIGVGAAGVVVLARMPWGRAPQRLTALPSTHPPLVGVEFSRPHCCFKVCVWWIAVGEAGVVVLARVPFPPHNA